MVAWKVSHSRDLPCSLDCVHWKHTQPFLAGCSAGCAKESGQEWQLAFSVLQTVRECTRDEEWRLLLVELSSSDHALRFLAEQTGGDAVSLQAPVDWQGDEPAWLGSPEAPVGLTDTVQLSFKCSTILVSDVCSLGDMDGPTRLAQASLSWPDHRSMQADEGAIDSLGTHALDWDESSGCIVNIGQLEWAW